jgi:hypothetical protein
LRGAATLLLGATLLVACGGENVSDVPENRQFANDPAPTRVETATPALTATDASGIETTERSPATPADLLRTRGAPSSLYTVSGGSLFVLTFSGDDADTRIIAMPEGTTVLGTAASPTGDRVGVLTRDEGGGFAVRFYDVEGNEIGGPFGIGGSSTPAASPAASPIASPAPISAIDGAEGSEASPSITWIPQGNGVLVVRQNALYAFDIERGMEPIPTGTIDGTILRAAASPMGGQIIVHVAMGDGSHAAYLIQDDSGETHELHALRTVPGRGVGDVTWLPGGNGVLFVRGEIANGEIIGGELYSYQFRNEVPRLVATSGQGGPTATITNVAISPDGATVAYDVSVHDGNAWVLHSMWLRSLKQEGVGIEVPALTGSTVRDLHWCDAGLTWISESRLEPGTSRLYLMTPTGEVLEITPATPSATPLASPGATPMASPAATPGASPAATPENPVG